MKKLDISELMKISDALADNEWLLPLIDMNNRGKLRHFLNLIGKSDVLNKVIADRKKQTR